MIFVASSYLISLLWYTLRCLRMRLLPLYTLTPFHALQNALYAFTSNYIHNLRCQKHLRPFVGILHWSGVTQTITCFVTFVITKLKVEDHMYPFFPFVSSPWRNCPKIESHHSIEMLHLNFSEFLFNMKWAELSIFFEIITENTVAYVTRSGNCRSSAPCEI